MHRKNTFTSSWDGGYLDHLDHLDPLTAELQVAKIRKSEGGSVPSPVVEGRKGRGPIGRLLEWPGRGVRGGSWAARGGARAAGLVTWQRPRAWGGLRGRWGAWRGGLGVGRWGWVGWLGGQVGGLARWVPWLASEVPRREQLVLAYRGCFLEVAHGLLVVAGFELGAEEATAGAERDYAFGSYAEEVRP